MNESINPAIRRWLGPLDRVPRVYVVGGSVRDCLLGRQVKDIDLVCADPKSLALAVAKACKAAFVSMEKDPRAACYRVVNHDNPDDFVDISGFRGQDIRADLARRDFTVNAMALEAGRDGVVSSPGLIDPLGGQRDLAKGVMRAIGRKNLEDDPLRVLRGFRLAAQLGFFLESATLDMMAELAPMLYKVSWERIQSEILLLFSTDKAFAQVLAMDSSGVVDHVFPEIIPMRDCGQNAYHHQDVWRHSLEVFDRVEVLAGHPEKYFDPVCGQVARWLGQKRRKAVLKLAALLHDMGKPCSRAVDAGTGGITFYGHDKSRAHMAVCVAKRLRMSAEHRKLFSLLVAQHLHAEQLTGPDIREKTRLRWFRKLGDDVAGVLILAMADLRAKCGPLSFAAGKGERERRALEMICSYFTRAKALISARPLIGGKELMRLGLSPGPEMGRVLESIREAQDAGEVTSQAQAMDMVRRLLSPICGRARG